MSAGKEDDVHRLLDIVVEEISLVDRAANKHRFLIVKRSDPMEDNATDTAPTPNGEANDTSTVPPESPAPEANTASSGEDAGPPDGSLLEAAVQALEDLTDTVEALGTHGDARAKVGEIATELRTLADRLAEATRTEPATGPEPDADLAAVLASVRATLQQVGSLIDASKAAPTKTKPKTEAPEPDSTIRPKDKKDKDEKRGSAHGDTSAPSAQNDPLRKDLAGLADSVRKLVEGVKEQAQRLSKLEKRFGLPNSAPAREQSERSTEEDVGWPMDLNRPLDRDSVDKSVSFHD